MLFFKLHFDTLLDTKVSTLFNTDTTLCQTVQTQKLHIIGITRLCTTLNALFDECITRWILSKYNFPNCTFWQRMTSVLIVTLASRGVSKLEDCSNYTNYVVSTELKIKVVKRSYLKFIWSVLTRVFTAELSLNMMRKYLIHLIHPTHEPFFLINLL